ncbi:YaaA family protein [Nakamurella leprariae]|uniref:Peroxide stress protein YaaA n=1 Tax=Nakamurella leprariae TaxID=2803911 RepID=A0A938YGD8_9ACTN|nr:peroxide stress protein YaaA [Nakamurella leprariae]MBM9467330.1 peroxide stress protein YaaA [Nakamurella leprariae]
MLILLPPSETKATGGDGAPVDPAGLVWADAPGLTAARERQLDRVVALCADLPAARAALGVSAGKDDEVLATAAVRTAPTLPAVARYTGVLFDHLDVPSLPPAARERAGRLLLISSALFGVVAGADRIPAYRLSAGSVLPGGPAVPAGWRPVLTPVLAAAADTHGLVLDLRSGAYAAFAPVPGAVGVRVLSERPDGSRTVVSHFSKAAKGRLARALLATRAEVGDVATMVRVARRAGLTVERPAPDRLDLIT